MASNNEKEVKMFGKDNRAALSKVSTCYDVGDKGFLTDTEKQMRGMDSDNLGHLTNAQVSSVVTETLALREKNDRMKTWIGILGVFVIILALSNLGTAFAAAWLAKDTTVNESTGQLLVKDSDTPVTVRANGQTSTLVLESSSYGCMDREEAATLWSGVLDGTASGLTIQGSSQQDADPTIASFVAKTLITNGATWNETMACMPISNDNGRGEKVCIDFTDNLCDADRTDRALEVMDHHTRRKLFHAATQGDRDLKEKRKSDKVKLSMYRDFSDEDGAVDLGFAGNYTIIAKAGISTVPQSMITGNIAVSPIALTAMTGFSLIADASTEFLTSTQIAAGYRAYGANSGGGTPAKLTVAVGAMETAYTNAAGRLNLNPARLNIGGGFVGGDKNPGGPENPLTPGVYTFGTGISITGDLYFNGQVNGRDNTDAVFIIQSAGTLWQASNTNVILSGGANAKNIFWQVAGAVTIMSDAHLKGILLAKTAATFVTGSSLEGRVLAQTRVDLQMATITQPE
jgi:hypothetical protein